ncbi:MAG TPA: MarR family transcriptional regulator, partial [Solirubrobacteraceae bacterium]|nr:MarR family transcriptional regulator [Solirubrobacteraceae bacterium]
MLLSSSELNLAQLLKHPYEALVVRLHEQLALAGFPDIRPAHGCVFQYTEPDGSRLTDLARRAGLTKPTLVAAVHDLERLGYVERLPDDRDRRAKVVRLTARGAAAAAEGAGIISEIETQWASRLGAQHAQQLRRALEEL